jgi:hypothetical protein
MKIIANKYLFDAWINLTNKLTHKRDIISNDFSIPDYQIRNWKLGVSKCQEELNELFVETLKYIYSFEHCKQWAIIINHPESDCLFLETSFNTKEEAEQYLKTLTLDGLAEVEIRNMMEVTN